VELANRRRRIFRLEKVVAVAQATSGLRLGAGSLIRLAAMDRWLL
jgi:hypothetical protein